MAVSHIGKPNDYSLAKYTTFKIGGPADLLLMPKSMGEFEKHLEQHPLATVLGCGSNVLISSIGVRGPVILTTSFSTVERVNDNILRVGAGCKLPRLAQFAANQQLSGVEFFIGIPGTIGGAVVMNSSANNQAVEDIIASATIYNIKTKQIEVWNKAKLDLRYRNSAVKTGKHIVLSADFLLKVEDQSVIDEKVKFNVDFRLKNHPRADEPSAGSTFKNPQGTTAGKLIDSVGAKGMKEGQAEISTLHANFIINRGGATSLDVSRLMCRVYQAVCEEYAIKLRPEIEYIGEKTAEEENIWDILNPKEE